MRAVRQFDLKRRLSMRRAQSGLPALGLALLGTGCTLVLGIDGDYHQTSSGGASSATETASADASTSVGATTSSGGPTTSASSGAAGGGGGSSSSASSTGSGVVVDLVDDMEDDDDHILVASGRQGNWYSFNDTTPGGSQMPPGGQPFVMSSPGAQGSLHAARSQGMGYTNWGAGFGADFDFDGTTRTTYDASSYQGVSFWAKAGSGATTAGKHIRLLIDDINSDPQGGICDDGPSPVPSLACHDAFGADIVLADGWTQYTFTWAELTQQEWGLQVPSGIAKDAIYSIKLQMQPSTIFDTWIDDFGFIE